MKVYLIGLVGLFAGVVLSCSKVGKEQEGEMREKVFSASYGAEGTKVSFAAGDVLWKEGDRINWFTCNGTTFSHEGYEDLTSTNSGESVDVHVTYTSGTDTDVFGYFVGGTGLGTPSEVQKYTSTSLYVKNGIQLNQNGLYPENTVLTAAQKISDNVMKFKQVQSYISFSIVSKTGGGGTFDNIKITSKDGKYIAGNVCYPMSSGSPAFYKSDYSLYTDAEAKPAEWKTITLDDVKLEELYYVAIMPGDYTNGIKISLCNGTNELAYVETLAGFEVEEGEICNLGVLDAHRLIPAKTMAIWPESAYIVNRNGLNMTKKIWVEYTPGDASKVTWSVTGGTAKTKITPSDVKETYDGVEMSTAILDPGSDCSKATLTVTATLTGGMSKTCTVYVGEAVDLGLASGTLWAYSNVKGTKTGAAFATPYDSYGDYYMWGTTTPLTVNNVAWGNTAYNPWGISNFGTNYGGKYYSGDSNRKLSYGSTGDDIGYWVDDAASGASVNVWKMPTKTQFVELTTEGSSGNAIKSAKISSNGVTMVTFQSRIKGYTDIVLYLPCAGVYQRNGFQMEINYACYYYSSEVYTVASMTQGNATAAPAYSAAYHYVSCKSTFGTVYEQRIDGMSIRVVKTVSRPSGWATKYKKL